MSYPQPQVYGALKTTLVSRIPRKLPFAALGSRYRQTSKLIGSGKMLWLPLLLFLVCPCTLSLSLLPFF